MKESGTIQKIIAVWLLALFTFSVTPKRFLHDAIADHKDAWPVALKGYDAVQKSEPHCYCDSLVAESPFVGNTPMYNLAALPVAASVYITRYTTYFPIVIGIKQSRGPPCAYIADAI